MPLAEVIRSATENPAKALRRPDLGSFRTGCAGDASILKLEKGAFDYVDSTGETLNGATRLVPRGVVIQGAMWHRNGDNSL
jgi:dihydroorotase